MKFGDFMVRIKKELPHVFLLAGEERYYIPSLDESQKINL